MSDAPHPLSSQLEPLFERRPSYLEGSDAQQWQLELEWEAEWMAKVLPPGALVFANNGVGDHLFLTPGSREVSVFWHEGAVIEVYCRTPEELLPDSKREPTDHGPVTYWRSEEIVELGDRVEVRVWLFWKYPGKVVYVPGVSPRKPSMERDGLAWVGIKLDEGGRVDTIVMPAGHLQKSVTLVSRGQPHGTGARRSRSEVQLEP